MAYARYSSRIVLCVWTALLLILSIYLILVGQRYADLEDPREGVEGVPKQQRRAGPSVKGKKDSIKSVESIGNAAIRNELEAILSAPDPPNSRAPFDKVVALSSLLPKITNISRMSSPNPETFRDYIAPMGLPVIFTDMLEGEKLGEWTWDYVQSKWGSTVYHNTRQGNYSAKVSKTGKHSINRVTVTLEDFIDVVTGKKKPRNDEEGMYIAKKRVIPIEALEEEFYYPPFYPGAHKNCFLEPTGW